MSDRICTPQIVDAGLPGRTAAILRRDERAFPYHAERLAVGRSRSEQAASDVVHDKLVAALGDPSDHFRTLSAAFLAGRCTTGDDDDDAETAAALAELVASFDPTSLKSGAEAYVEGCLSLALVGRTDEARARLVDLVTKPDHDSIAGYLAAAHLAQLGDPQGWPRFREDLHDRDDAHNRMMATRHLVAFVPYDGDDVDGTSIDVAAEYAERLRDRDSDVAEEVPELIVEARLTGAIDLLTAATKRPHAKPVRKAAEDALRESGVH